MFKSSILCILITIIFFSQIVEINANLWRKRSQDGIFTAMVVHEKDIFIQTTNMVFIRISSQNAREENRFIIRKEVKKWVIIATITVFLRKLVLKAGSWFKTWAVTALSKAFEDWRDSLYH